MSFDELVVNFRDVKDRTGLHLKILEALMLNE